MDSCARLHQIADELEALWADDHPSPFANLATSQLVREAVKLGAFQQPEYALMRGRILGLATAGEKDGDAFEAVIATVPIVANRQGRPVDNLQQVYSHIVSEVRIVADPSPLKLHKDAAGADVRADGGKKFQKNLPDNEHVSSLARRLSRELPTSGKSRAQIAAEYGEEHNLNGESLLRKIREYHVLREMVDNADPRKK